MKPRFAIPVLTTAIAACFSFSSRSTRPSGISSPAIPACAAGLPERRPHRRPDREGAAVLQRKQGRIRGVEAVDEGLGPTMNLDSCAGCHAQPATGGTSPALNPQIAFARKLGANNVPPSFLRADGPVREARFVRNADGSADGGVHANLHHRGRSMRPAAVSRRRTSPRSSPRRNVIFRIPTAVFARA